MELHKNTPPEFFEMFDKLNFDDKCHVIGKLINEIEFDSLKNNTKLTPELIEISINWCKRKLEWLNKIK